MTRHERPKVEAYDGYTFLVFYALRRERAEVQVLQAQRNEHVISLRIAHASSPCAGAVPAEPCLLVDDIRFSGWTLAMVAGQLRGKGADAVYPLALSTAF